MRQDVNQVVNDVPNNRPTEWRASGQVAGSASKEAAELLARVALAIWQDNTCAGMAADTDGRLSVRGAERCYYGERKWNAACTGAMLKRIGEALTRC
jgi:hypothetical protein